MSQIKPIWAFIRAFINTHFSKRPKLQAMWTIGRQYSSKCLYDTRNPSPLVNFPDFSSLCLDKVWIYNISKMTYYADTSLRKNMKFPGKRKGEKYAVVTSIPDVIKTPVSSADTCDPVQAVYEDGKRVAMDMVNPDNLGLDQDATVDSKCVFSQGRNLGEKGVFWSTHKPPLEAELKAARKRMKKYYTVLLERAQMAYLSGRMPYGYITPEHHAAAEYFKITNAPWHPVPYDEKTTKTQETQ